MNEPKKILFVNACKSRIDTFWNKEAEEKCRKYNFIMDIPALNGDCPEDFNWAELLPDYDAIVTTWSSPVCTKEFLAAAPKVKVLGHSAGSIANVTDATTFETDVRLTTANPIMSEAVAEWSLLATLLAQRHSNQYASFHKGHRMVWGVSDIIWDLRKLTVGLWGLGDTTKNLLKLLAPLRLGEILVCSNHASEEEIAALGAKKASLEELLTRSDIFHCLVGANKENLRRIGAKEFAMMKEGSVFVNAGRSKLSCPDALLEALKSGHIRAILDVFESEPLEEDSPLYELDNVIMTPHDAGYTGRDRFLPFVLDEFDRFFRGEPMLAEITRARQKTMTVEALK